MTQNIPSSSADDRPALPWLLVIGLASLSLLWPLAELIGVPRGAPRALTIIAVVAATWIGVVGLGRVPRPVLVLTLTGLGYGLISMTAAAIFGEPDRPAWTIFAALAGDVFWGMIAGLLALAVQKLRRARA